MTQTTDGTEGLTFGQTYHAVFVVESGQPSQIYINGAPIPLTHANTLVGGGTLPAGALTGPLPILATDELTVGDTENTTQNPVLGTLGRITVYPYAVTAAQAAASYRLQADQALVVGMGRETPAGATNRGPVAVPFTATGSIANPDGTRFLDIDVAGRSFDSDGNTLTARVSPVAPEDGSSSILANNLLRYIPEAGSGGFRHTVPFGVRDPSGAALQSNAIVRVNVTGADVVNRSGLAWKSAVWTFQSNPAWTNNLRPSTPFADVIRTSLRRSRGAIITMQVQLGLISLAPTGSLISGWVQIRQIQAIFIKCWLQAMPLHTRSHC